MAAETGAVGLVSPRNAQGRRPLLPEAEPEAGTGARPSGSPASSSAAPDFCSQLGREPIPGVSEPPGLARFVKLDTEMSEMAPGGAILEVCAAAGAVQGVSCGGSCCSPGNNAAPHGYVQGSPPAGGPLACRSGS